MTNFVRDNVRAMAGYTPGEQPRDDGFIKLNTNENPYPHDWKLPAPWPIREASITFLPNPNSPSGTTIDRTEIERLAEELRGPLVLDEAYVDFADDNGLSLTGRRNVIITRTFSKSYA